MTGAARAAQRREHVLALLDEERRVLLNGPVAALPPLVEKREALVEALLAGDPAPPESFLAALKARAERNSRLILASIAGVKAAKAQIARMDGARDTLRTYGADGAAVDLTASPATHDSRA